MLLMARCAPTFTTVRFPSATLIRLYEFLKNSRAASKDCGIVEHKNDNTEAHCPMGSTLGRSLLRFEEVVEDDGIEPTTPCLQSRCSPS
jgi:hypothetical protein